MGAISMTAAAPTDDDRSVSRGEANAAKVTISGVSRTFRTNRGDVPALGNVSLSIRTGEVACFVGPSGCGKTTLLNIIAGLDKADSGTVLLDGRPVAGPGSDRVVMFQEAGLFPWLDVMGNVMFGLKLRKGLARAEMRDIAERHIEMVGLTDFRHAFAHELSGGMKQRVALARALAPDPDILLMDEPFSALDALTRERLYDDVQAIWAQTRKTVIFVTHNVREAACLGDRVFLFAARPGRVCDTIPVPLARPRNLNTTVIATVASAISDRLRQVGAIQGL
jgi:NitT/TauT family transport system ATP-binding protein